MDDPRYTFVAEALARTRGVTRSQKRGFGQGALKVGGKVFAMLSAKGEYVVKLPAARVAALAAENVGRPFEVRGKAMKEWLVVTSPKADWISLAREALKFVQG